MTKDELIAAIQVTDDIADAWAGPLTDAMAKYSIDTPLRQAAFLAQVAHESAHLHCLVENLNYSSEGLLKTFPTHFDESNVADYARNPVKIANRVYANRMGNGDEASGDGWKHRGQGPIQITGSDNAALLTLELDADITNSPELLQQPVYGALSAAWFWSQHDLNDLADQGLQKKICQRINGGLNGLDDRIALFKRACQAFGIDPIIND